jgi:type IX secretion system PorP/SprF family membrane protein
MKKIYSIILLLFVGTGSLFAQQDVHFSQFFSSPLTMNPASAGVFNGDFRAITNYRSQWGSVSEPFTTMAASIDFPVLRKMGGGMFGVGLNFFKDDAGDSKLSTMKYNLSVAYHLDISGGQNNNFISVGFQGGMIQRSMNYSNLTWNDQWNGITFDQDVATVDMIGGSSINALDISTGIHWYYAPTDFSRVFGGISLYHLNSPNMAFNDQESSLLKKFTLHGGAEIGTGNTSASVTGNPFSFLPNLIFVKQGPNQYFDFGGEGKYRIQQSSKYTNYNNEMYATLGAYYRWGDAAYIVSRFSWSGVTIAASYDFNLSTLSTASNGNGGFEIMLGYVANFNANPSRGHSVRFK